MGDTQSVHQPVQVVLLGALHCGHQVLSALFAEAVQLFQLGHLQGVQVRRRGHHPRLEQLLQNGGAQAVDIHGVPAGKVDEVAQQLGRALGLVQRVAASPSTRVTRSPQEGHTSGSW